MKTFQLMLSCMFACALAQAQEFVTYEEFGAIGDGKADDLKAIIAAHAAANATPTTAFFISVSFRQ